MSLSHSFGIPSPSTSVEIEPVGAGSVISEIPSLSSSVSLVFGIPSPSVSVSISFAIPSPSISGSTVFGIPSPSLSGVTSSIHPERVVGVDIFP